MTLDAVLSALGAPDARELLEPGWDESMQSLPSSAPHFLWPANVVEWREYGGFGPELDRLLLETAKRVGADPALHRLAWHVYRLAFVEKDTPSERFRRLPLPHALLGEQAGLFYLLIANAVVPLADLELETVQWCREMLAESPLALRMLKASHNAADDGLAGVQQLAGDATLLFYMTQEAQEGRDAYKEKRRPDFGQFPKRP